MVPATGDSGRGTGRYRDRNGKVASRTFATKAEAKRWVAQMEADIQHRLGHASITTTMNRYGHLLPDVDAARRRFCYPFATERGCGDRRRDPASGRTYRLTCAFMEWAIVVSNHWPLPCQGSALPLS